MLLTRGDPADRARARSLLTAALSTAQEFELLSVEREAAALLGR
jgi:hypothetical protein